MERAAAGRMSDSLKAKQQHYSDLGNALQSDGEDEIDHGRLSSVRAMQKALARKRQAKSVMQSNSNVLARSASESNLVWNHPANSPRTLTASTSNPEPRAKAPSAVTSASEATYAGKDAVPVTRGTSLAITKTTGKRKREAEAKTVPNEQQIFKDQHIYFFPNSDKHPARKKRIAKAVEYGATWEKEYSELVTLVVMDKAMDYALLIKYLKMENLPCHIAVVSENYPAECITFNRLLDPRQPQFKVKGYSLAPPSSEPKSSGSAGSLQLKPANESVRARRPETPVESEKIQQSPAAVTSDEDEPANSSLQTDRDGAGAELAISSTAEMEAAIQQARDLQHVPLDNEEEAHSRPTSSDGPTTDDEGPPAKTKLDNSRATKYQSFQDKFSCMQKHTGTNETPNAATIAVLQQMADYYDQIGDEWRTRAYRKAMSTLRNHPKKLWTREEALALPQIGDRLATKIEEIAFTNRLRRLDNAKAEPQDHILQTFMTVYWVGFAQASKWVNAGYTTLDELVEKAELTDNQRIGIAHFADFNSRIPRAEVEKHGQMVRKALQKIDPAFEVIVGGSYRRGAETSGDIDCIITRPNTGISHIRQVVLDQLVPQLFAKGVLVAELAATSRDDGSKWHGASCIPSSGSKNPWRRIDLLLVPSDEIGAALIYLTGNDIFNRSLRLLASTKGMRLNQRGLYKDVIRGKGREKLSEGTLVEGRDEKRIFAVLGVPWRPPEHRIC